MLEALAACDGVLVFEDAVVDRIEIDRGQDAAAEQRARSDGFKIAQAAYAAQGFPGEERFHHQGGPTGYGEREWVATPNGTEVVVNNQAFAWNPSIRGGKTEDTVLLHDGVIENLTPTPELPTIQANVEGSTYAAAGVLVK